MHFYKKENIELVARPGDYRDSPARRKTVQKSQKKLKKADDKENEEAQAEKKSPLSAIPLNLTPLKSTKKKGRLRAKQAFPAS